jgi:hypothetical protein
MTEIDTGTAIGLWVGLCIAVGLFANRYGRSGLGWFVMSMIVSPLLGVAFVLALGRRA